MSAVSQTRGVWPRACSRCLRPMWHRYHPRAARSVYHAARGLCEACHKAVSRFGDLAVYERMTRPYDMTLEEWRMLRAEGHDMRYAAERLTVGVEAVRRAELLARS